MKSVRESILMNGIIEYKDSPEIKKKLSLNNIEDSFEFQGKKMKFTKSIRNKFVQNNLNNDKENGNILILKDNNEKDIKDNDIKSEINIIRGSNNFIVKENKKVIDKKQSIDSGKRILESDDKYEKIKLYNEKNNFNNSNNNEVYKNRNERLRYKVTCSTLLKFQINSLFNMIKTKEEKVLNKARELIDLNFEYTNFVRNSLEIHLLKKFLFEKEKRKFACIPSINIQNEEILDYFTELEKSYEYPEWNDKEKLEKLFEVFDFNDRKDNKLLRIIFDSIY